MLKWTKFVSLPCTSDRTNSCLYRVTSNETNISHDMNSAKTDEARVNHKCSDICYEAVRASEPWFSLNIHAERQNPRRESNRHHHSSWIMAKSVYNWGSYEFVVTCVLWNGVSERRFFTIFLSSVREASERITLVTATGLRRSWCFTRPVLRMSRSTLLNGVRERWF